MPLIQKNDVNQIFASQAPLIDQPANFTNYPTGWGVSRPSNGKPTIKQFNYLQQRTDQNILYIHQNGAALPFDETIEYAENATVLVNGELKQKKGNKWVLVGAKYDNELILENERTQREKNKDAPSILDFYKQGDASMSEALDRAFLETKSLYIPSSEFTFLKQHTINGDNLELWGDGILTSKVMSFLTFTGNNVKIKGVTLQTFNIESLLNSNLLKLTGSNSVVDGIKVWGSNLCDTGIETTGNLNKITNCFLKDFYSYNGSTQAIRSVTSGGSIITNNEIINLNAEKSPESAAWASARAIYHECPNTPTNSTLIANNVARNIFGVEGDSIHVTSKSYGASRTQVIGNLIDGFSRRGIKVQASNTIVSSNTILSDQNSSDFSNLARGIDIQYSSDCIVSDNTISLADCVIIQIAGARSETLPIASRNIVKGNTISLFSPSRNTMYAIFVDGTADNVFYGNTINTKSSGFGIQNSTNALVKDNNIVGGNVSAFGINLTATNSNCSIVNNTGLNYSCTTFIRNYSPSAIIVGNNSTASKVLETSVNAVGSIVRDNVGNSSSGSTQTGDFAGQFLQNGGFNLAEASSTFLPSYMFSSASPATAFPSKFFSRGFRVYNSLPSNTVDSPLCWVAASSGIASSITWIVEKVSIQQAQNI